MAELRKSDRLTFTTLGSANMTHLSGPLRLTWNLEEFKAFIRQACHIRAMLRAGACWGCAGNP